jgi:radical SAM superfamily enzyme YgiQ (UPF0313 family)
MKNSNITFIDPPGISKGLNIGLAYLAAVLNNEGRNVTVVDLNNRNDAASGRISAISHSDLVGFSIKSFTLRSCMEISSQIPKDKRLFIAGGPHITLDGVNFLNSNPEFDFGVRGEGEETLPEIIRGETPNKIKGIVYRDPSEGVVATEKRAFVRDLDKLPFPDYSGFDSLANGRIATYPLITSRGCPFPCKYCSVGRVMGMPWRERSPKNVIEELLQAKEKYRISHFDVLDDNFTLGVKRAKDICQLLMDENVQLSWGCPNGVRADRLDDELLGLMKRSGCESISIGIESCNPTVFESINKSEKLDTIFNSIKLAKEKGIRVNGFLIVGLPDSTYDLDKDSLSRAQKLNLDGAQFSMFVPYPGTAFWETMTKNPEVKMLRPWYDGFNPAGVAPHAVFETTKYTEKEKLRMFYFSNLQFKSYKLFFNENASLPENIANLMRIIVENDPLRLPLHLMNVGKQFANLVAKRAASRP